MIKTGDYVRGDSGLEGFVERIVDDNLQSKKTKKNWKIILVLKFTKTASREALEGPDVTIDQVLGLIWVVFFNGKIFFDKFPKMRQFSEFYWILKRIRRFFLNFRISYLNFL